MLRSSSHTFFTVFALVASLAMYSSSTWASSEIDQHLRDQYQHKTLVLRGFFTGKSLHFDYAGNPVGGGPSGDWTVDAVVQVNEIKVKGNRLSIRAARLHLGWFHDSGLSVVHDLDAQGKPDKDESKNRALEIEADLGSGGATTEAVDAALARIFLTSRDDFSGFVPEYWKPCVRAALGAENDKSYNACRFSTDLLAALGVAGRSDLPANTTSSVRQIQSFGPKPPDERQPSENGVFHVGRGVSPPRVISQPGIEFSEYARKSKFQGTVVLSLIVDREGLPRDIHITNPIGCGLDEKAVQAAEAYRFKPGEKDGEPVAVKIALEVDFHLY